MRRHARGFTLIEVLVVLSVLGILATLAAPALQKVVAKQRLRSVSYDLMTDLTLARSEALKRGSSVVLEPLTTGNWTGGWRLRNVADSSVLSQRPSMGVSVGVSQSPTNVTFDGSAQVVASTTVKFGLTDGNGNYRCIQLDPTGRPKSTTTTCP